MSFDSPSRRRLAVVVALAGLAAGCASSADSLGETAASVESPTSLAAAPAIVADEPIPTERCEANRAAGTITFLTSLDFAAASSTVDVITAEAAGYYKDLCLDVDVQPGSATDNYPSVASGDAQFASGGSFSEMVAYGEANNAELLAATVEGRSSIDTLIVRAGEATELKDLVGARIGVQSDLPPSIEVMLRDAGVEAVDVDTVPIEGRDPTTHFALDIDALSGLKSDQVGALERAGVGVQLFDPLDFGVPGSFGLIYTNATFSSDHPTAAQDFVRATMRGLADAVADPEASAQAAVTIIAANGNPLTLSADSETYRWTTETALILEGTPEGVGLGVPDLMGLQAEIDAYADVGVFGSDAVPDAAEYLAADLAAGVYNGSALAWPS